MANRVLIVDDEKDVRESFQRALEISGHIVSIAAGPDSALEACQEESFDLVILDYIMPGMDGIELLVRIRKCQPHVRSIVVSGKLDSGVEERHLGETIGELVAADMYLHKPISREKLLAAVSDILNLGSESDWVAMAERVVEGHQSRLSNAKKASQTLKKHKKRG